MITWNLYVTFIESEYSLQCGFYYNTTNVVKVMCVLFHKYLMKTLNRMFLVKLFLLILIKEKKIVKSFGTYTQVQFHRVLTFSPNLPPYCVYYSNVSTTMLMS